MGARAFVPAKCRLISLTTAGALQCDAESEESFSLNDQQLERHHLKLLDCWWIQVMSCGRAAVASHTNRPAQSWFNSAKALLTRFHGVFSSFGASCSLPVASLTALDGLRLLRRTVEMRAATIHCAQLPSGAVRHVQGSDRDSFARVRLGTKRYATIKGRLMFAI
jgi:hypothetical protein